MSKIQDAIDTLENIAAAEETIEAIYAAVSEIDGGDEILPMIEELAGLLGIDVVADDDAADDADDDAADDADGGDEGGADGGDGGDGA